MKNPVIYGIGNALVDHLIFGPGVSASYQAMSTGAAESPLLNTLIRLSSLDVPCGFIGGNLDAQTFLNSKIQHAEWILFEGSLWEQTDSVPTLLYQAHQAKNRGQWVMLTLPDKGCIQKNQKHFLKFIVENYAMVFGATHEYQALLRTQDLTHMIQRIQDISPLAILTMEEKGTLILDKQNRISVPPPQGFGTDISGFLCGFLYGIINGYDLKQCGNFANVCAGKTALYDNNISSPTK